MSRAHPFDSAFGAVADSWFPEIRDEAASAGKNTKEQGVFLGLASVRRMLEALAPEEREGSEGFVILLFSAYCFWEAGCRTLRAARGDLEARLDRDPAVPVRLPDVARYIQLPERWLWSRVLESFPHEPLDGMFVVPGAGNRYLLVVGVLGLRPDRGGYSQIFVTATPDEYRNAAHMVPPPRFAPAMEGGAAAGFRSVNSNAELLLLASLALTTARE